MYQISLIVLTVTVVIALMFQIPLITRVQYVVKMTGGVIRTHWDLKRVKGVINLSMKLAVFYIVFLFCLYSYKLCFLLR